MGHIRTGECQYIVPMWRSHQNRWSVSSVCVWVTSEQVSVSMNRWSVSSVYVWVTSEQVECQYIVPMCGSHQNTKTDGRAYVWVRQEHVECR